MKPKPKKLTLRKATKASTGPIWNRQPTESPPAFEAFKVYRDMGLKRSLSKAAKVVGKQMTLLGRWSTAHEWVMRATEYDNYQEAQQASLQDILLQGEADKWAERQKQIREKSWELSEKLISKAEKMLSYPITRRKKVMKDGKTIVVITPNKWGFQTVTALVDLANKLGRQSAEMPTEIIEFINLLDSKNIPQEEIFEKLKKQFENVPSRT